MERFIITGFSDEIDEEVREQFTWLNKLGISWFEPRGIDGKNISDLNDEEVLALKAVMEEYGISVSSIGSPIGKIGIRDDFEEHLQKLERIIKTAKMLGTGYIRMFSFYIPKGEAYESFTQEVIRRMKAMAALAAENDKLDGSTPEKFALAHKSLSRGTCLCIGCRAL